MTDLDKYRSEIDEIDSKLTELFLRRMKVTTAVGEYKKARNIPVLDAQREREVLKTKAELVETAEDKSAVTEFFKSIMAISRRGQRKSVKESEIFAPLVAMEQTREPIKNPKVAYQGMAGAYTEEATVGFFGEDVERTAFSTWEDVFVALEKGEMDYGVFPIENNSTGSIIQIYDLLNKYGHFIVGEYAVKVDHCLMACKGAKLVDLKQIHSHEQGLLQCADFLKNYPEWEGVACLNTAIACENIAKKGDLTLGAIGSKRAAKIYNLEILADEINMSNKNFTRFVVVSPVMECRENSEKISTSFTIPHKTGALHEIMTLCAVGGMNLTKIESRPILGQEWEYRFFMDFNSNVGENELKAVLIELCQTTAEFRLLGRYKSWELDI